MTFQNISLLIGLAAIGIPIALHLIARKEPKKVTFPSIRLLQTRFETNRSKLRVRRWWLLALRIAALALVALAFARPAIAGALSLTWTTIGIILALAIALFAMASVVAVQKDQKTLTRSLLSAAAVGLLVALIWGGYTIASGTKPEIEQSAPVALALVIDNPPTSAWTTDGQSRLDQIKDAAKQLIVAAGRQSRITVIDRSATPAAFALDPPGALSKVDALTPLQVTQPIESRIEAAARLLQSSEIRSRQLVVLSGLTRSSFTQLSDSQSIAPLVREAGIRVTHWDMGALSGVNRSLSLPVLSDRSPAPEASVTVTSILSLDRPGDADAAGAGTGSERRSVTAECVMYPFSPSLPVVRNGEIVRPQAKPVDRINVELEPGRDLEIRMTLPPLPIGLHHGAIRLVGEDALPIDDAAYFTVSVLPPSRLLIAGDRTEEAEEIAWAVSAPAPIDDPAAQYLVERVGYDDLAAARLDDFDGVLLLDPPASMLSDGQLEQFRRSGGSVLVAVGNALGEDPVSAAQWPRFERRWRVPDPGTFFEVVAPTHPAIQFLANLPGGVPFQDYRVHQYWQVDAEPWGTILMRFAGTDHPALVESRAGADPDSGAFGRTLILATPIPELGSPSTAWNDLFSADEPWPAFLLVRELVTQLTGRNAHSWTYPVGSAVSIPIDRPAAANEEEDPATNRIQWFPPQGSTPIPLDVSRNQDMLVIERTRHSGVHWLRGNRSGLGFTTNTVRDGLSTERIAATELEAVIGPEFFRDIDSIDQMEWTATDGTRAVSLWSPLMLIALLVFMLEQVLGNRFYRRPAVTTPRGAAL